MRGREPGTRTRGDRGGYTVSHRLSAVRSGTAGAWKRIDLPPTTSWVWAGTEAWWRNTETNRRRGPAGVFA